MHFLLLLFFLFSALKQGNCDTERAVCEQAEQIRLETISQTTNDQQNTRQLQHTITCNQLSIYLGKTLNKLQQGSISLNLVSLSHQQNSTRSEADGDMLGGCQQHTPQD